MSSHFRDRTLASDNEIWALAIRPGGRMLACCDKDGTARVFSLPLPRSLAESFPARGCGSLARPLFSPDSTEILLSWAGPGGTGWWNPRSGAFREVAFPWQTVETDARGRVFMLDIIARELVVAARDGTVLERHEIPGQGAAIHRMESAPGGSHVAVFLADGTARVWDGRKWTKHTGFSGGIPTATAFSPGGRYLAEASWQSLRLLDQTNGRMRTFPNDPHWAKALVFTPDGATLISGGVDARILLRDLPEGRLRHVLDGHLSEVSGLAIDPTGRTLVSAEIGEGLRFWRMDTFREVAHVPIPDIFGFLWFSPDGATLAVSVTGDRLIAIPCGLGENGRAE